MQSDLNSRRRIVVARHQWLEPRIAFQVRHDLQPRFAAADCQLDRFAPSQLHRLPQILEPHVVPLPTLVAANDDRLAELRRANFRAAGR